MLEVLILPESHGLFMGLLQNVNRGKPSTLLSDMKKLTPREGKCNSLIVFRYFVSVPPSDLESRIANDRTVSFIPMQAFDT